MSNTHPETTIEDIVIIGGGTAGLAASIYTARANLNPIVFAGSPSGGQLMLTSEVENYPGFESILGPELIEKMRSHAKKFGVRIVDKNVVGVDFSKKPFQIFLPDVSINNSIGNVILARAVLIATGAKALWLGLESEKRLQGKGVSACATCDGFFFRDKIVGVVGGGDTAMEEALTLTKFAKKVYIIHRRDIFRASKIMQERVLKHPKIEVIWNTGVREVMGENRVEGIRLKSEGKTTDRMLNLDGLFIAIGHKPDTELFKGQVELDDKGYVITSERFSQEYAKFKLQDKAGETTMQHKKIEEIKNIFDLRYQFMTSVDGVFAAGDCVDYVYRQAATASGMGVAAALEIEKYLSNQ